MGKEGQKRGAQNKKEDKRRGWAKKNVGQQAAVVKAESTLAAGWTQVSALSSASGYCPCSAWYKPHMASTASPACPPAPELQPQLDTGLGGDENRVDHEHLPFRCSQMLPVKGSAQPIFFPRSGDAGEHPQHFLAGKKGCEKSDLFLHSIYFSSPGGVHWRTWHKDWCLAYGIKQNLFI